MNRTLILLFVTGIMTIMGAACKKTNNLNNEKNRENLEKRGYHSRSLNSNQGRNATEAIPFINFPLMSRADEIENAVLIIHGEKAHSRYFGEDAFKKLKGDNKELMIIPGASHTDLYDNLPVIPFDKMMAFFQNNLK